MWATLILCFVSSCMPCVCGGMVCEFDALIVLSEVGVNNMHIPAHFHCMSSALAQSLHKFILDSSERQRCCCDANNALGDIACYQSRVQLLSDIV